MAYSAMAVANAFIKRAKEGRLQNLSPMKLQKLLYYAHSWNLALKDKPLLDDFFARWTYGPVIPSLYHEFKEYGASDILDYGGHIVEEDGELVRKRPIVGKRDEATWALIDRIIEVYGGYSGAQLSSMTHSKDSAWSQTGEVDGGPIPNAELARCVRNVAKSKNVSQTS
ncbi:DUF4065 domain-containing protein [Paraburkholderia nemoris]|uniref:Panacea domain-containing protein n=1 Tax=Paraburkholderia nemoris TaxID=2793076 RepID=UPI0038BAC335